MIQKQIQKDIQIEPQYCIFFEDIARNLKPAHELGMVRKSYRKIQRNKS